MNSEKNNIEHMQKTVNNSVLVYNDMMTKAAKQHSHLTEELAKAVNSWFIKPEEKTKNE